MSQIAKRGFTPYISSVPGLGKTCFNADYAKTQTVQQFVDSNMKNTAIFPHLSDADRMAALETIWKEITGTTASAKAGAGSTGKPNIPAGAGA